MTPSCVSVYPQFCGPRSHARPNEHRERSLPTAVDPPSDLGDLREPLALGRVSTHATHIHTLQGEISAWQNVIETQRTTCTQSCTHTHTHTHTPEVASGVGRNLEKARPLGNFTEWPVCKSRTIAASLHLFIPPSLHPSIYPGKKNKSETLIHEPWVRWTDVFQGHFAGTLERAEMNPLCNILKNKCKRKVVFEHKLNVMGCCDTRFAHVPGTSPKVLVPANRKCNCIDRDVIPHRFPTH